MRDGDLDGAIAGCRYDRIMAAGNVTYQYVNIVAALAAMRGASGRAGRGDDLALRLQSVLPLEGRIVSRYMMNKFIRAVEMSTANVNAYVADTEGFVDGWLAGGAGPDAVTDDRMLTPEERTAFVNRDYGTLYGLGAHP